MGTQVEKCSGNNLKARISPFLLSLQVVVLFFQVLFQGLKFFPNFFLCILMQVLPAESVFGDLKASVLLTETKSSLKNKN